MNSILTKYQDMQCVAHCNNPATAEYFDQPVLQTLQMFMGELLCWIPIFIIRYQTKNKTKLGETGENIGLILAENDDTDIADNQRRRPGLKDSLILAIPSTCDLLGTTLMNIGLLYTPVSIYQMTRGSIILIVGLMSVIFLKKRITKLEWISLFVVFLGVFLVGLSGYIEDQKNLTPNILSSGDVSFDIIIGMGLVFLGITMSAMQFVVEEHILSYLKIEPMEIVGYEGLYGSLVTIHGMLILYIIYGKGYFDIILSFKQMFGNSIVLYTSLAIMLSISIFNFCGITLTNILNATARSTIDTTRTLLVWIISLIIGWENFHALQLFAFALLVAGTLSFNGIIQPEEWSVLPAWLKDLESEVHT
jgi:drug/metabolite transporter (DMT)-like permease